MGIGNGLRRPWRAVLLLAVGGVGGAAAIAVATVPDGSGVIHACVNVTTTTGGVTVPSSGPNAQIVDPGAGQHCLTAVGAGPIQTSLSWNVQGQQGAPGANGKSVTVVSGHTLTLSGGNVITVGGGTGKTVTITTPTPKPSGKLLTLQIGGSELPILGYSLLNGGGTTAHGTGGRAGRVRFNDIAVTRKLDKASAKLALACVNGTHFKTAVLTVHKSGGGQQKFLTIKMTTVFITSYQASGNGGNTTPTESMSLNFTKASFEYGK